VLLTSNTAMNSQVSDVELFELAVDREDSVAGCGFAVVLALSVPVEDDELVRPGRTPMALWCL